MPMPDSGKLLLYSVTGLTILLSLPYLKAERIHLGEYYGFILLALSGMMVMVSGADLLTIYLGTELMSLSLYVMAGLNRSEPRSLEASAKYFVLGAFSSGILLYGISLLYGASRQHPADIDRRRDRTRGADDPLLLSPRSCWQSASDSSSPRCRSICGRRTSIRAPRPPSRPSWRSPQKRPASPHSCVCSSKAWAG